MRLGRAPRVAVVGPRRVRTGLGPFLAKHLVAAGAEVPAFIASRKETIADGRAALAAVGIDACGYVELDELIAAHPVDALVIATPHETHRRWLEAAVDRGLHALCEKPLVWDHDPPSVKSRMVAAADPAFDVGPLLQRAGVVFENCPWPYALPAFGALHPNGRNEDVRTFEMEMAPSSGGAGMLVAAMSHPLSVLQKFTKSGEASIFKLRWTTIEPSRIEVSFKFIPFEGTPIDATVRLRTVPSQPRPMAIAVNGRRAERRIRMEDYALFWCAEGREVPIPDPMAALVADFVRTIRDGERPEARGRRTWTIQRRLTLLAQIVGSFPGS